MLSLFPTQVSFNLNTLTCGSSPCGDGRYKVTYFAALSRFTDADAFISDPKYDSLSGNYQGGTQSISAVVAKIGDIFIGEVNRWWARSISDSM